MLVHESSERYEQSKSDSLRFKSNATVKVV